MPEASRNQALAELKQILGDAYPNSKLDNPKTPDALEAIRQHFPAFLPEGTIDAPAAETILKDLKVIMPGAFGKDTVNWEELVRSVDGLIRSTAKLAPPRRDKAADTASPPSKRQVSTQASGLGDTRTDYDREVARFPIIAAGTVIILLSSFVLMVCTAPWIYWTVLAAISFLVMPLLYKIFIVYPLKSYISQAFKKPGKKDKPIIKTSNLNPYFSAAPARHLVLCLMRVPIIRLVTQGNGWGRQLVILRTNKAGEHTTIEFGKLFHFYSSWIKCFDRISNLSFVLGFALSSIVVVLQILINLGMLDSGKCYGLSH